MSDNSFGRLFRVTTWGESHGPAIGCVIDGCPPGIDLVEADLQARLDRRRPGQSRFTTQRREPDAARILSGVYKGKTTGAPIAVHIDNVDARSKDYAEIEDRFRPGHADFAWTAKYGVRDPRGGGRSSARETAARVAAGAVAAKILGPSVVIRAGVIRLGGVDADRGRFDWSGLDDNPFFSPDPDIVPVWEERLDAARRAGSSLGAVVEVQVLGAPTGLGEPVYGKLDAELAAALMSINACKGVEIGAGFGAADLTGEENADEIRMGPEGPVFLSNHAGGVLGGVSSGQDIVARAAFKPTSSILTPRRTITALGQEVEVATKGRHDPCVGIRAAPVVEAMTACVLADAFLRHRGVTGGGAFTPGREGRR